MGDGRKKRLDSVFGEEGAPSRAPRGEQEGRAAEPPLAGLFGARSAPLKDSDRKSPAQKPAPRVDPDA